MDVGEHQCVGQAGATMRVPIASGVDEQEQRSGEQLDGLAGPRVMDAGRRVREAPTRPAKPSVTVAHEAVPRPSAKLEIVAAPGSTTLEVNARGRS